MTDQMFSVDGTAFSTIGDCLLFESTDYQISPEYDTKFTAIAGYEGGRIPRQQVLSRTITLNVTLEKTSEVAVRTAIKQWNALVGPHTGEHKLILDEWPDEYWKGVFKGSPKQTPLTTGKTKIILEFLTYTTSYSVAITGYPAAPDATITLTSRPQSFSITNNGSAPTYPHWMYTTVGSETVEIYNETTDEDMVYEQDAASSNFIEFIAEPYLDDNSEPWIVKFNGDIYNYPVVPGSTIPRLEPGVNIVSVSGAIGGVFNAYWRDRNY